MMKLMLNKIYKKYYDAAAKLNQRGDEWDRLHPNDKCRRIQIK